MSDWLKPSERNNLIAESNLTPTERSVLGAISHFMFRENLAWPSLATLAQRTGLHRGTVIRTIKALESKGCLKRKVKNNGRTANRYEINFEKLALNACTGGIVQPGGSAVQPGGSAVQPGGSAVQPEGGRKGNRKETVREMKTDTSDTPKECHRASELGVEGPDVDGHPYGADEEWEDATPLRGGPRTVAARQFMATSDTAQGNNRIAGDSETTSLLEDDEGPPPPSPEDEDLPPLDESEFRNWLLRHGRLPATSQPFPPMGSDNWLHGATSAGVQSQQGMRDGS